MMKADKYLSKHCKDTDGYCGNLKPCATWCDGYNKALWESYRKDKESDQ